MTWSMIFLPELNSIEDTASRQRSVGVPGWQVLRWPLLDMDVLYPTLAKVTIMTENFPIFLMQLSIKTKEKKIHAVHNMVPVEIHIIICSKCEYYGK